MEKILVTGGSGFLGSYIISKLINTNKEVIVFDNGFRQGFSNISSFNKNITLVKGDVTKREDWELLPKDVDFVFHLAAINGTKYFYEIPDKVISVNVLGTMNFVDWLQNTNVKRFFFASSSEVYGKPKVFPTPETEPIVIPDPSNPRYSYSSSKMIGETITINFAKSLGINYSIARIHNAYGPKMGNEHVMPEFIRKCVKNESFTVQGDGTSSRSFCYVSDIVDAIILISTHPDGNNEIFNIGNPTETSINQLIELLEKIHGKEIKPMYTSFPKAGTDRRVPDLNKISKLGYKPKISLEDGLKKTYDWYAREYTKQA